MPTKNTTIKPEIMYLSSNIKYVPAKITVVSTIAINTAIPPRFGMELVCDVRPLGVSVRFFDLEIFTIDGMINQVRQNAIKNPSIIIIQWGINTEGMLTGKFTIRGFSCLSDQLIWLENLKKITTSYYQYCNEIFLHQK